MRSTGMWRRLSLGVLVLSFAGGACGRDERKPAVVPVSYPPPAAQPSPVVESPAPDAATSSSDAPAPVAATDPKDPLAADRWYDVYLSGSKLGYSHVVWSTSTWHGQPTLHDQTTQVTASARQMLEMQDEFRSQTVSDVERSVDGRMWWMKRVQTEGSDATRETVSEVTWTGDGYDIVVRLKGVEEKHRVAATEPACVDAEAFLGGRLVARTAKVGDSLSMPVLDEGARKIRAFTLAVLGVEPAPGLKGDVPCTKVRQTDAETGVETFFWLDAEGGIARLKAERTELKRVSEAKAKESPSQLASYTITAPQTPPIERIFSADRTLVDVVVAPDADRPMPEFPASPFSRVTGVDGDAASGWTVHAELKAYDAPDAKATIPVADPRFAKDLEPTVLMPCGQPNVLGTAKAIVGNEKDARKAAEKIAVWVHDNLEKESGDVAETTAVEILEQRKGDCSEHCVLFVALCRAVGIPARRCSGYVCVGMAWGGHAWAEIWTGAWIGADPTTSDVGTSARYLFFGKPDDPESRPGLVSSRAQSRLRFVVRHVDEGADHVDLTGASSWSAVDKDQRRAVHRLVGFDLRGLPADWDVAWRGPYGGTIRAPGLFVQIYGQADQGDRRIALGEVGPERATYAGAPAVHEDAGERHTYTVASRRRKVTIVASVKGPKAAENLKTLEKVLAPTFTPKPTAP